MKSYLRFLSRNKLYTAIEVLGLSIAIAVALPLLSYSLKVNRINRSHPDHKEIYSLSAMRMQTSSPGIRQQLLEKIPEIEKVCSPAFLSAQQMYNVDGEMCPYIMYDHDFLYFFPHEFIEGDLNTETMSDIAVSESLANELAKSGPVVGRSLNLDNRNYTITGIFKDSTDPRLDKYDILVPRPDMLDSEDMIFWGNNVFVMTLIKAHDGTDFETLKGKVQNVCAEFWGAQDSQDPESPYSYKRAENYDLIPYRQFTVKDNYQWNEFGGTGYVILTVITCILLIFALINYINLNVALSTRRAKEIATRKLVGSGHRQVIMLFLRESLIMNLICFGFGLVLTGFTTDIINTFFKNLNAEGALSVGYGFGDIALYIGLVLTITVITGIIPALIVSRFTPLDIAKGSFRYYSKKRMTKVFICVQTIITVLLLILTVIFNAYYKACMNMEYNCEIEDVFFLYPDTRLFSSSETLKSELEKHPEIISVGHTDCVPSYLRQHFYEDTEGNRLQISVLRCDKDAFEIFGFDIISERDSTDRSGLWMTPEAERIAELHPELFSDFLNDNFADYREAGMIHDIPTYTGMNEIDDFPAVVFVGDTQWFELAIKTTDDHEKARKVIAEVYEDVSGIKVHDIHDFAVTASYITEFNEEHMAPTKGLRDVMAKLFGIILILGVMGLTGISIYFATEREKEIAIRKVFGGTSRTELRRNLMTFVRIALIANILVIPLAIFICDNLMWSYEEKISGRWMIFGACILASFCITLGSVLWQTLRAARTNPVEALKKE